ncbi:MAG: DUF473 domain-containing protein [Methanothrix sp.]|jgi:hypothetical protein|nr:DUF473 domain-containing protein [Methanothrix sp.]NPU87465.1 DUF473 domain-containing protein [Methanothrix sp.]
MVMICVALTGISRNVIKDLVNNRVRTVEIRSPLNFFSLRGVNPGDRIFVTEASLKDIVNGTPGVIARVNEIQIMTHRMIQSNDFFYEEIESQAARAQLQFLGIGRVRRINTIEPYEPFVIEVDEMPRYIAR